MFFPARILGESEGSKGSVPALDQPLSGMALRFAFPIIDDWPTVSPVSRNAVNLLQAGERLLMFRDAVDVSTQRSPFRNKLCVTAGAVRTVAGSFTNWFVTCKRQR